MWSVKQEKASKQQRVLFVATHSQTLLTRGEESLYKILSKMKILLLYWHNIKFKNSI